MSLSDKWEFEFTAATLAEAADTKFEKHTAKQKWWEGKKVETMTKVKESGIEVRDSVAATYSNTKGGFGPQIEIDGGLQRDLIECQDKLMEHYNLTRVYGGWAQVLHGNPESRVKLHHDDWLFFFGE
jgi:hypothetical protein